MFDPEKITYFGETDSRNRRIPFGIKAKDRLKHVYVIGKTGMGKSTLLENMAVQDIAGGEGMCFIDPHGKTAELLLEYIPPERVKDVVYFAPFDIEHPISFNVMEDVGPDKRHLVVNGLMSAFKKLFGEESFSDRMQYILQNTILALLEYPGSTMLGINRMLTDKDYRDKVVANVTDSSVKAYWTQEFANYTERFAAEATPAIQNKIGQFTSNPLVRNIIGQEKSSFDFRKIMDEGKIMIVNLSKGRVGEANANLLGSMLITKIYLSAMSRADQNEAALNKLPNFYLFVDEFQSFANESFADILSEARKYKLNLTIAHQYIEQMAEEVRAAVFGNVGTMITFRVGAYDAETLEKEFAPVFIAEDLVNLGSYQIYLKLMIDGISSQPFSATTLPPIKKPEVSSVDEVIKNSRLTFAKPRALVEKIIGDWHEEGKRENVKAPPKDKRYGDVRQNDYPRSAPRSDYPKASQDRPRYAEPVQERREPVSTGASRGGPKPMDLRGKREYPPAPSAPQPDYARQKEERQIKKEAVSALPQDDFKPLSALSLTELQKKQNNQRDPSPKNLNDLRSALSAIVKTDLPKPAPTLSQFKEKTEVKVTPPVAPQPEAKQETEVIPAAASVKAPDAPKEVPEDTLKNLLGVE
ncbi:MAG: hypothetical protein JWN50_441 [Parcubacteria group bacterium]|nr:hypothetical protein [Parcubacteria group bacterium]